MNIFVLDMNHDKNVQYYANCHIVKMITESAQLLSSTYYFTDEDYKAPYKLTHKNHPCAIWTRHSVENWLWLRDLSISMYTEYQHRYGNKIHKSGEIILNMDIPSLSKNGFTEPPKCMPDEYKSNSLVQSYRNYYRHDKMRIAKWKNRDIPDFMK